VRALLLVSLILGAGPELPRSWDVVPPEAVKTPAEQVGTGAVIHFDKDRCEFVVKDVIESSPAQQNGIRRGDTILGIAGVDLTTSRADGPDACTYDHALKILDRVEKALQAEGPGVKIPVRIKRDSKTIDLSVGLKTIGDLQSDRATPRPSSTPRSP